MRFVRFCSLFRRGTLARNSFEPPRLEGGRSGLGELFEEEAGSGVDPSFGAGEVGSGAQEIEVSLCAGCGDVEEASFLFEFVSRCGAGRGELVFGEPDEEDGLEL